MAKKPTLSAQEKRWRAESDLSTLNQAATIQSDPARVRAAQKIAQDQIRNLQKVAGAPKKSTTTRKK